MTLQPDIPALLAAVRRRPLVTVLCGSTRFGEAFARANLAETLAGRIVLSIGCDLRSDAELLGDLSTGDLTALKDGLDALHRHKIALADDVLVLNVGGYIGSSTRAEIAEARRRGKPIRYLESVCDNTSVFVIAYDEFGRVLVFERATFPAGVAVPAGHVDDHGTPRDAAITEVAEETGLQVVELTEISAMWRGNRCRRHPGDQGTGHQCHVFQAAVTGDLNPSECEARNARWVTADELQALADRTVHYAHGRITDAEFEAGPGLEPVQVQFLVDAGLVLVSESDLVVIDRLAARGGHTYEAITT
jgi:8-oxo-dGTP pyrophosphatase MutT (NUDIX family)